MFFRFTEAQDRPRETIRRMMEKEATAECMRRLDGAQACPYELNDKWGELRLLEMPLTEACGSPGGSVVGMAIHAEKRSRKSCDWFTADGRNALCRLDVAREGPEAWQQCWLAGRLARAIRMSVSVSEPGTGSVVGAMHTTAPCEGDHCVINGQRLGAPGASASGNLIDLRARTGAAGTRVE